MVEECHHSEESLKTTTRIALVKALLSDGPGQLFIVYCGVCGEPLEIREHEGRATE